VSTKTVLSREEKIQTLKARIENFMRELQDPKTFTYSLYQSNSPKKDYIRAWGEALEDLHKLGEYKEDICMISTTIRNELKEMNIPHASDWARKVLPFKYKDSAKIHAGILLAYEENEIRGIQARKTKEEITAENKPYINELTQDIKLLEKARTYLETHEMMSKIDPFEMDEYFTRKRGSRSMLYQIMDGRVKVLTETFHLLMTAYIESTKSNTFAKYMEHLRKIIEMTPKQAVKLITGRVSKVDILYEPKSRSDARMANFYGVRCGECGSWRIDLKYHTDLNTDMLFCYACKNWNDLKTEKLVSKMI